MFKKKWILDFLKKYGEFHNSAGGQSGSDYRDFGS